MKNKTLILLAIVLGSALTAFNVPETINTLNVSVATNVTDEYEEVMVELEAFEKQLSDLMTEKERNSYTPLIALVARSAAVVRASVAVTRAAIAATRAASEAIQLATRLNGSQLLATILGLSKINKIPSSLYYTNLKEFQLYQLG